MVVNCEVKFDNNLNGIFFAGQTLSGVVELTIDKPKKIRGLILKIEGFAEVQWTESEMVSTSENNSNSRSVTYSGREDYISSVTHLIGSPSGNEIEISPGQYRYNFQSVLPAQIPTSCEAPLGHIRYLVSVVLDRPFKFDLTYKVAFSVIKQLDLNYENPALRMPAKMELVKTFYCGLCKTKPLYLCASIPFSGYVSGQEITVSVDINNESRVDINHVKISLKKIIRYSSQTPGTMFKEETSTEAEIRCGQIMKRSKETFVRNLLISPVPPSNLNYCKILTVRYEVQVKCKVSGPSLSPVLNFPIIIGTVPLTQTQNVQMSTFSSAPPATPSTMNLSYDAMIDSGFNRETSECPPSYYEATYLEENGRAVELNVANGIDHPMGNVKSFHPMYPVYGFRLEN